MENKAILFDKALKFHHIKKTEFAAESKIPYDTVAGWKKRGSVPDYAFVLLKKIAQERRSLARNGFGRPKAVPINQKTKKIIQAAFWGKNYTYETIVNKVVAGDTAFVKPFFENLYYKDALKVVGTKNLKKVLPEIKKVFPAETAEFWETLAAGAEGEVG